MSAAMDRLLGRLERVRPSGGGGYRASCPGPNHRRGDQSAGLCIDARRNDPPGVVLYCPAGCTTGEIIEPLGLGIRDLYDEPIELHKAGKWIWINDRGTYRWKWDSAPRRGHTFNARQILESLEHEVTVVMVAASDIVRGRPLSNTDAERVALAAGRISKAREMCQ